MLDALPAIILYLGIFISYYIYMNRAGLMGFKREQDIDWREFIIPNMFWFIITSFKAIFWPIVFCIWLFHGRPPCPWRAYTNLNGQAVRVIKRVKFEESSTK